MQHTLCFQLRTVADVTGADAELRLQVFEWLLLSYDADLHKAFPHDGRVTRIARQLALLGTQFALRPLLVYTIHIRYSCGGYQGCRHREPFGCGGRALDFARAARAV